MKPARGKHQVTWSSLVVPVALFAGHLAALPDDDRARRACADIGAPTNFDYLVLASIADSPRLPSMAGFRFRTRVVVPKICVDATPPTPVPPAG
jgi:hypothetical protein